MVRLFDLRRLPHLSATAADSVRLVARRLGGSTQRLQFELAQFGLVSLKCLDIEPSCPPDDADALWSISRRGRSGYLLLDSLAALRMVAMALGLPAPRALRSLGAAERGIVAATIASFLRAAASDAVVTLGPPAWNGEGLARILVAVDFGAHVERVRFDVPPEWFPPAAPISVAAEAKRQCLEISLAIELARTTLTALDWSDARPGDAVVFENRDALRPDQDWIGRLVCGAFVSEISVSSDGRAQMVTEFQRGNTAAFSITCVEKMEQQEREIMSSDDQQPTSLTALASAPIEVVAEIGRIVMRADEVTALRTGTVFSLGPLRPSTVVLRIADRTWAHGELVDIDGQLGVRLTALTPLLMEAQTQSRETETVR